MLLQNFLEIQAILGVSRSFENQTNEPGPRRWWSGLVQSLFVSYQQFTRVSSVVGHSSDLACPTYLSSRKPGLVNYF